MSTELEKEIINLRADLAAERAAITSLRANAEKQGAYVEGVINDYAVALAKAEQDLAAERAAHADEKTDHAITRELYREANKQKKLLQNDLYGLKEKCGDEMEAERTKREQAEAQLAEMQRRYKFTYCACCGETFEIDAPDCADAVGNHIRNCAKHPMREVEQQLAAYKRRDDDLVKTNIMLAVERDSARAQVERLQRNLAVLADEVMLASRNEHYNLPGALEDTARAIADTSPAAPTNAQGIDTTELRAIAERNGAK